MQSPLLLAFQESLSRKPEAVVLRRLSANRQTQDITAQRFLKEVSAFTAFFQANAVAKGDVVGVLAGSNSLWLPADLALISLGAASVCLDTQKNPSHWVEALALCRSSLCLAATPEIAHFLIEQAPRLPNLRLILVLDQDYTHKRQGHKSPELAAMSEVFTSDQGEFGFAPELTGDETAAICLSDCFQADDRAVMWSHQAFLSQACLIGETIKLAKDGLLVVLNDPENPLYRWVCLAALLQGWVLCLADRHDSFTILKSLGASMVSAEVDFLTGCAQRLLQPDRARFSGWRVGHSLLSALYRGETRLWAKRSPLRFLVRACRLGLSQWSVFGRRRAALGNLEQIIVSSLDMAPSILDILSVAGLKVSNFASSAEAGCLGWGNARYPNAPLQANPGAGVQIRDSAGMAVEAGNWGQVFAQGSQVMKGYLRQPLKTREILDRNGTIASGLAACLNQNRLIIAGPAKYCIQTSDNKLVNIHALTNYLRSSYLFESAAIDLSEHGKLKIKLGINRQALSIRVRALDQLTEPAAILNDKRVLKVLRHTTQSLFDNFSATIPAEICEFIYTFAKGEKG